MGPILRIGENQKAPAIQRPPNRSNDDATFIVLQERDDFCGLRVVPIGKLFEKNTAGRQVGKGEQRKTFAQFEFFRFWTHGRRCCARLSAKEFYAASIAPKDNCSPGENLILFFGRNLPANN
jgi:hypothetical protein